MMVTLTFCHGCKKELPPEDFGTYTTTYSEIVSYRRCKRCRTSAKEHYGDFGFPGKGKLKCEICKRPLAKHRLGEWCL